jgi:peptidoglycan/xylan/chitin deacetylase (PgdA/CDA1 family)
VGQPISGAGGPITEPILDGSPDLAQNSFYEYGAREGAPRILDLMDKHRIKMSSFTVGEAVPRHPDVAAEIVNRGHEAGAHGRCWERQYQLDRDAETQWIADSAKAIDEATGFRPVGYNNSWIRPGVNTLEILQELGFSYHIDDLSADEPFLHSINGHRSRRCLTRCTSTTLPALTFRASRQPTTSNNSSTNSSSSTARAWLRRHVSLLFMDPADPYHWIAIQAVVVKIIDEDDPTHGNVATESINEMSQSYLGESTSPLRDPAGGEVRSLYRVRSNRVQVFGHV